MTLYALALRSLSANGYECFIKIIPYIVELRSESIVKRMSTNIGNVSRMLALVDSFSK
nr:hypothetical protein TnSNPV_23 [Trichoplusia ni single nucleopolyhedrovirus]